MEGTRRRVDACREQCGAVGGLLLTLALDHAGDIVRKRLAAGFGGAWKEAYKLAQRANERAADALDWVSALWEWMRVLERKVDSLTHGVGETGRTL